MVRLEVDHCTTGNNLDGVGSCCGEKTLVFQLIYVPVLSYANRP